MKFTEPLWLFAAALLLLVYLLLRTRPNNDWSEVISLEVLEFLGGTTRKHGRVIALLIGALTALALANPSTRSDQADSFKQTSGWIVLADISRSMTLDDVAPTRLSAIRVLAEQLSTASSAAAAPIALIIYAGDAFLAAPPAIDNTYYSEAVALLEYGLIPVEGSNLTRALSLTSSVIESSGWLNSRIIILTDTGGINSRSESVAAQLRSAGHLTDVITVGTSETSANAEFNLDAAASLASSGGGVLHQTDSLGRIKNGKLRVRPFSQSSSSLIQSGIDVLRWRNHSHWILLACIPLMLLMFHKARR